MKRMPTLSLFLAGSLLVFSWPTAAASFPEPEVDASPSTGSATAVLAGGCFWCTEAVFEPLDGVKKVVSGYAGGTSGSANYKAVSSGASKHAEVIEITYNPAKISYGQLLKIFFSTAHDPTQLNRQGPDHGRQYRSAIFYANDEEKRIAEAYVAQLNQAKVFSKPIVTTLEPLTKFYRAEGYHQDFVSRSPRHPYVVVNALPKVKKLKKNYPELLK
ncbi:MAG: peptide-methionine (S)-S-oxide reductase MsrA [bacterium]|nr:peptide-methionine (S)-S-oxide reductase MsrA [bacterium]